MKGEKSMWNTTPVVANATPSLADIAAVTDGNRNNSWGDGGGWWAWIILLALCGWGGFGGFGGGFGGGYGAGAAYAGESVLQRAMDTQSIIQKLDGINSGICSLGYDQLAQMNGINTNILQTGFGIQQAVNNGTVAGMQSSNALSRQLADCCCENRQGQADLKYTMATDTCAITTAIERAAQSIMQNDNANYRQLHDENVAALMAQKDEKIQEQASLIQSLNLAQSQANQNNYLVNTLRPCPQPAYITCNPFTGTINPYGNYGNGCGNNGCCNNSCC